MKRAAHIIFITLLVLHQSAIAQSANAPWFKRCPVKTINFESGLMNNGTTNIITDNLGFTWVSTVTGLQRYDGYTMQIITPIAGKDTFNINYPVYFFGLQDGTIWISFKQTILGYHPASNSFSRVISLPLTGTSPFNIIPLKETADGIWCMQENKGIVIYNRNGKLLREFSVFKPSLINGILNSTELLYQGKIAQEGHHIFINENNNNFIYTSANNKRASVLAIDTKEKKFQRINLADSNILGMSCTENKLCVLSNSKLIFVGTDDYQTIKNVLIKNIPNENVTSGSVQFTAKDKLLLSINNHLFQLDTAGNYSYELTGLAREPVVAAGFIFQIYPDKFKRIWLITNNDIKRIENVDIPFTHFIYPDEKNNFIRSVYYDRQKNLLIGGCFYNGIQLYDTLANPLLKKTIALPLLKNILSVEKLTNDEYLVITFNKGWFVFNSLTITARPLNMAASTESLVEPTHMNFPNNIQRINNNVILIATSNNVFRCTFSGSSLLSAEPLLHNQPDLNTTVFNFLYDSYKSLWVGTYKGNIIQVTSTGELHNFSLPQQYGIRCFAEDAQHHVWIGSDKGLYVFTNKGELLKEITIKSGLRNDCIYAMLPSDTGASVYASSNMGISYVPLDGAIKNFSKEMGLQENEFNTNAAYKSSNGKFYFGGINGITAFYPGSLSVTNDSPFLYLTRLVINDSLYNSSAGVWARDSISLSYDQNRLRFDIAAIGLLNTNEYVYQYRLKGFEESWQTTYLPTGISYKLEPGNYDLEIICHPVLSSQISFSKKFIIIIHPAWWQTWWFNVIAFMAVVGIIAFVLQQYNRRKYQRQIQVLKLQQELQHERERISRELHDDIGTRVNMLAHNVSQLGSITSDEEMEKMQGRMKDTSDDMLQSLKETVWTLKQESITTEDVWFRFKNFIVKLQQTYSLIQFQVEEIEGLPGKKINYNEALNLIRILQEAVNNAIKHSGCRVISCTRQNESDIITFTVIDDGKGFDEASPVSANKGNGLANMKQRAKESGFSLLMTAALNKGTSVILKV